MEAKMTATVQVYVIVNKYGDVHYVSSSKKQAERENIPYIGEIFCVDVEVSIK
jgi:hypothetical protein